MSSPPTVDDALRALTKLTGTLRDTSGGLGLVKPDSALGIVLNFLRDLEDKAEPEGVVASDTEGYIIEGALQRGFDMIADNGNLLVVHKNDLIKYVLEQRKGAAALALQKATRESLPPVVISIQDDVTLGRLVLEFGNTPLFGEGRLRKDVLNDLRNLMGIGLAAEPLMPKWVSTKRRPLPLGLNVKAWDQPVGYPLQVWAGFHKDSPKTATCDWFIELPPLPVHDAHDAPAQILKESKDATPAK